ncbi:serine/threonine-protein phosphatase [bacterium]|nr:serine/threonine-protein phosphatase [bacterium]
MILLQDRHMDRQQRKNQPPPSRDPRIRETVWKDLKEGDLKRNIGRDLKDLYEFYVDPKTRERLNARGKFIRWLHASWHILKVGILKLTPARRFLLLLSLILAVNQSVTFDTGSEDKMQIRMETNAWSYVLLLVVLMAELKDKLLARNELETGRQVQAALMPQKQPDIPGWDAWIYTRPANDVGGDLVDDLDLKDCHGLAIGDVAGKGLGAALLMSKLQATIRALAPLDRDLSWLGRELNGIFYRDCLPNRFSSLVFMQVSPESGEIRFLNAGHLPPLLLKGNKVLELERGEPALGLMPDVKYRQQTVELENGDFILVYSDGLTDARSATGEFFGEDRIKDLLRRFRYQTAEACGKMVLNEVKTFTVDSRPEDDLSLIILKKKA